MNTEDKNAFFIQLNEIPAAGKEYHFSKENKEMTLFLEDVIHSNDFFN